MCLDEDIDLQEPSLPPIDWQRVDRDGAIAVTRSADVSTTPRLRASRHEGGFDC